MSWDRGTPIHVVVADPHPEQRDDLRLLLDSQPDMGVVAEAGDAAEALRQVRACDPDVLILDLAVAGDSIALIARLRQVHPWTRVLVVTAHDAPADVLAALTAGANGYVLKPLTAGELLHAVRTVFRGCTIVKVTPGPGPAANPGGCRRAAPLL